MAKHEGTLRERLEGNTKSAVMAWHEATLLDTKGLGGLGLYTRGMTVYVRRTSKDNFTMTINGSDWRWLTLNDARYYLAIHRVVADEATQKRLTDRIAYELSR